MAERPVHGFIPWDDRVGNAAKDSTLLAYKVQFLFWEETKIGEYRIHADGSVSFTDDQTVAPFGAWIGGIEAQ